MYKYTYCRGSFIKYVHIKLAIGLVNARPDRRSLPGASLYNINGDGTDWAVIANSAGHWLMGYCADWLFKADVLN